CSKLTFLSQKVSEPIRLPDRPAEQQRCHDQDEWSCPVFYFPEQVHSTIDDENVDAPEDQKRQPGSRSVICNLPTKRCIPSGNTAQQEIQCFAANPGLNTEPPTRNDSAHERRQVRPVSAVSRASEYWERNPILGARMRVQENRNQHNCVAQQNRN